MAKSSRSSGTGKGDKPEKPYAEFPLSAHRNGQWCKQIRPLGSATRKMYYFGPWADPDAALKRYKNEVDDLMAGRTPIQRQEGLRMIDGVNAYLDAQEAKVQAGDLTEISFRDNSDIAKRILAHFGKDTIVENLSTADFVKFRKSFYTRSKKSKHSGPVAPRTIANEVNRARSVFKYMHDANMIEHPVKWGPTFKKPPEKRIREDDKKIGKRMFSAAEIRTLANRASLTMRAMIYLGINGGFGPNDCGHLVLESVDLDRGWIDFARVKTLTERRFPLWPETAAALRAYLETRPKPFISVPQNRVFVTRLGTTYETRPKHSPVGLTFRRLLKATKLQRPRCGFYWLRHTLETIGTNARDQVALDFIMGHLSREMSATYREDVFDEQLEAVTNHVREWLFFAPCPVCGERKHVDKDCSVCRKTIAPLLLPGV